jgi:transcriptional regulator with XRE-family HTH domain
MRPEATVLRHVGRRIAELRVARGWTQEAFAELAGVSPGYVRQIEGGRGNLTLATAVRFASLFGVDVVVLFTEPASAEVRRGRPPKAKRAG